MGLAKHPPVRLVEAERGVGVPELSEGAVQAGQVCFWPAPPRGAPAGTVKIDEKDDPRIVDEDVPRVEVGVPDAGIMKPGDGHADGLPDVARQLETVQEVGKRPDPRQALRDELGLVSQASPPDPGRGGARHGQAAGMHPGEKVPFAPRPCAFETGPQIAVPTEARRQAAAPVAPQDVLAATGAEEARGAPAGGGAQQMASGLNPDGVKEIRVRGGQPRRVEKNPCAVAVHCLRRRSPTLVRAHGQPTGSCRSCSDGVTLVSSRLGQAAAAAPADPRHRT